MIPPDTGSDTGGWRCPTGRHRRSGTKSARACEACTSNATERAAALVAAEVEQLTAEHAAELVGIAVTTRAGLQQTIEHLQAHPDALRSARSDCPKVIITLIGALVDAGVPGVVLARCARCGHPRRHLRTPTTDGRICESCRIRAIPETCVGCGRSVPVYRRTADGVVCQRCSAHDQSRWQPCDRCGTPGRVARRVDGQAIGPCCYVKPDIRCTVCGVAQGVKPWKTRRPVCTGCAARERVPCGGCGQDAAIPSDGAAVICAVCIAVPARACLGCGRPTPRRDRAGAARCSDCYQRPTRSCGRCGRVRVIVRLAVGDDPELCAICWTGPTVECARCGQLRPCRGERRGRMLCSACAPVAPQRCAHCGRTRRVSAHWHEGPVCPACYHRALAAKGQCPTCGETRRLMIYPGWPGPVCSTCAGAPAQSICTVCGLEDALHSQGMCPACSLRRTLAEVLGDAAARDRLGLQPVFDRLVELDRPRLVLDWIHRDGGAAAILARFATGELALTHDSFDTLLPATRAAWFAERLLVTSGALPTRDPVLARLERWVTDYLGGIADPERRMLLGRFATWHLLRPLRVRSQTQPLTDTVHGGPKQSLKTAAVFLGWLDEQGRSLSECSQAVLDRWAVTGPPGWANVRTFLAWAHQQRLIGRLEFPTTRHGPAPSLIDTEQRWALARRLLHDPDIDPVVRVAGLLVVLYAQSLPRIVGLRLKQINLDGDQLELHLGKSPIRVPSPLDRHIRAVAEPRRAATVSAINGHEQWLFPGWMPGRHLNSTALGQRLLAAGIPSGMHRASALAYLVSTMPVTVVADLLGVNITTAATWAARSGRPWADYINLR